MKTAAYMAEAITSAPRFRGALPKTPYDPEVETFLYSATNLTMATPGIFGGAMFDMALDENPDLIVSKQSRKSVTLASHRLVLLEDIVDTRIDEDQVDEPLQEKFDFLYEGVAFLLGDSDEIPNKKNDLRYRAAFRLAQIIRSQFLPGELSALKAPMYELADSAVEQILTQDPEELMQIAHSIGASCIEGCAVFTELAIEKDLPHLRLVARSVGAYGELLDHAGEIDDDLAEGSNTYATARILFEGDSPKLREEISERYSEEAQDVYNQGKELLNKKQLKRYKALRTLIDLKFKYIDKLKRH